MIRLPGGQIWLEAGEKVPFECPKCRKLVPYSEATTPKCPECGYSGSRGEFIDISVIKTGNN